MFKVKLYQGFAKKTNSTEVPGGLVSNVEVDCNIKTPSSVVHPVIELATPTSANILTSNYAYISSFNRYYFINDIQFNNGFWLISLTCDVLATYKSTIGSSKFYVLRASGNATTSIRDDLIPLTCTEYAETKIIEDHSTTTWSTGRYILNVVGDGNAPGVVSYQLTPGNMSSFLNALYATANGYNWGDFTQGAINALFNPEEKIVSCFWIPKALTTSGTGTITLGLWSSGMSASKLVNNAGSVSVPSYTVTRHPQASTYGEFCNLAPYSEYVLDLGFMPPIKLDTTKMQNNPNVSTFIDVDPITGMASVRVMSLNPNPLPGNPDEELLYHGIVPYGVPISLATGKNNMSTMAGSVVRGAVAVSADLVNPALSALGVAVDTVKGALSDITSGQPSVGTMCGHQADMMMYARFFTLGDRDITNNGMPLCLYDQISILGTGYFICQKGNIALPGATKDEQEMVSNYLTSGFYYE